MFPDGVKAKYREGGEDLSHGSTKTMDGPSGRLPTPSITTNTISWQLNSNTSDNYPLSAETQTIGIYTDSGTNLGFPSVASN
ncbi:MAG: hypothetical protein V2I33_20300, partial [Kangiellaceae bacterium]|nr:hypothetical protein [Kangiellaceae bacterium]